MHSSRILEVLSNKKQEKQQDTQQLRNNVARKIEQIFNLPENACQIEYPTELDFVVTIHPEPDYDTLENYVSLLKDYDIRAHHVVAGIQIFTVPKEASDLRLGYTIEETLENLDTLSNSGIKPLSNISPKQEIDTQEPEAPSPRIIMPNLNIAAKKFDDWMKDFESAHRYQGDYDNNNKALVSFLNNASGFLWVKTYDEFCQLADLVKAKGYKTASNPPCTPLEFALAIDRADPKRCGDKLPAIPDDIKLEFAAEKFDFWMKNFESGIRYHGNYDNNNKGLIAFLNSANGFLWVKTYDEFCQLADLVTAKGYKTASNPPCTPLEFALAIDRADPKRCGDKLPVIPDDIKLVFAAEKFDFWMKDFVSAHRYHGDYDNNNKALVSFLNNASGFLWVKTYDQFCQLADLVKVKGYKTASNPPCTPLEFSKAIEEATQNYTNRTSFYKNLIFLGLNCFYPPKNKVVRSAQTQSLIDAMEGCPGRPRSDLYESDLINPDDIFKPGF